MMLSRGWQCTDDGYGVQSFQRPQGDLIVEVSPLIHQLSSGYSLAIAGALIDPEFQKIYRRIFPGPNDIAVWQDRTNLKCETQEACARAIVECGERITTAASTVSLAKLLAGFAKDRPDRPLRRQLFHLAALAYNADDDALSEYLRIFATGKTLNFVPAITSDVLERALAIAQERI
jgi:hypothetical protein